MKALFKPFTAGVMTLAALNSVSAQDAKSTSEPHDTHPIFISTDALMGAKTFGPERKEDSIQDLMIEASSGRLVGMLLESGAATSFRGWRWDPDKKRFDWTEDVEGSMDAERAADETFMLSNVCEYPLHGLERTEDGKRVPTKLGKVGGAFVDARSGHVAYVTTSMGGVLGIGAKSKVIPWSAVRIQRGPEGEYRLWSSITANRLENAPKLGDGPETLNNPEYRDTLYAFYGIERAHFEPATDDGVSLVPVDAMLGAAIVHGKEQRDSLKDLVIDPSTGEVTLALCENGNVVPVTALHWNRKARHFHLRGEFEMKPMPKDANLVLASALTDYDVTCGGQSCGDLEDLWFDKASGKLAYLTVEANGMRVLPWAAVSLRATGEEPTIELNCSKAHLESAPELDGEVGATVYSPAFRERVNALHERLNS